MLKEIVRCVVCKNRDFVQYYTYWECQSCGQRYSCVNGIPKLYIEKNLASTDKHLRDSLYNGLLGRFYNLLMPFLSIPVRPIGISFSLWGIYFLVMFYMGFLFFVLIQWSVVRHFKGTSWLDLMAVALLLASILFLKNYPYLWKLLLLAIPVKISLSARKWSPDNGFKDVHAGFQKEYQNLTQPIKILDIATGSCNSLYRHGWMQINATYTGIDLSEKMLLKGAEFMTKQNVNIDFMLADAHELPFETESYDIVTCYGAVNGCANIKKMLSEMARVTKKGGKILFLDEQLYERSTFLERIYFESVLSSHDVVKQCPVDMLPPTLENVEINQVYQFYYICTARKQLN
ncbi:MAG: class I SAM-dependent methyltransferase [Chloroflexi bacterium]|nr:class I SAM-dependent methyltransferase [Chloroflexota bacterium]